MDGDISKLIETFGGLGAFGLIAWLVRRTFTHTIPRLAGDFKESLSQQMTFFRDELRTQRDVFREELKLSREDFKRELEDLGERIDGLSDEIKELRKHR